MAATNFTPIILYHTTTASAAPTAGNLNNGELAINITDGKLFYKDNGGTVQVIATKGTGTIGGSNTQVQYNSSGALAGSANFTFNGTTATINTLNLTNALGTAYGGTALTTYTQGDLVYASAANTLAKLGIGLNTYILTSTGSVPQWSAPSAVTVSTANNLAGGVAGSVPYQSGAGVTTFLSIGTAGQVLTSSGSAPQWSNLSSLGVTSLSFGTTGLTPSTATQGAITVAGTLATTNGGTGLTAFTANQVFYASSTSAVGQSANLTFDGTTLTAANFADSSLTSGRVTYAGAGGNLTDSANLLYSGTDLTVYGITVGRGAGAVSTNTAVGASALAANTTGANNVAIGNQAGLTITTGSRLTAIGSRAGYVNTADNNSFIGHASGENNTSGANNTFVGQASANSNTTGSANTVVGKDALISNTTASNNTAVGYQAGYANTTANYATYLGTAAGLDVTTGAGNCFVGAYTGQNVTTGSANTFVGGLVVGTSNGCGSDMTTGSKNTILGGYTGNQGGLDIRTASNYIVLSDGDGNPRAIADGSGNWGLGGAAPAGQRLYVAGGQIWHASNQYNVSPGSGNDYEMVNRDGRGWLFYVNNAGNFGANITQFGLGLGNNVSGSGMGITFPATQSASSNANTLDDYEEGSWTPVLGSSGTLTGQTYSRQEGRYTKVGRLVTCTFDVILSDRGTLTGEARILGLPFTCLSGNGFRAAFSCAEFGPLNTAYVQFGGLVVDNTSQIYIRALTAAATASIIPNATDAWANTTQVIGTVSYMTA